MQAFVYRVESQVGVVESCRFSQKRTLRPSCTGPYSVTTLALDKVKHDDDDRRLYAHSMEFDAARALQSQQANPIPPPVSNDVLQLLSRQSMSDVDYEMAAEEMFQDGSVSGCLETFKRLMVQGRPYSTTMTRNDEDSEAVKSRNAKWKWNGCEPKCRRTAPCSPVVAAGIGPAVFAMKSLVLPELPQEYGCEAEDGDAMDFFTYKCPKCSHTQRLHSSCVSALVLCDKCFLNGVSIGMLGSLDMPNEDGHDDDDDADDYHGSESFSASESEGESFVKTPTKVRSKACKGKEREKTPTKVRRKACKGKMTIKELAKQLWENGKTPRKRKHGAYNKVGLGALYSDAENF